jgi:hypothetical protein
MSSYGDNDAPTLKQHALKTYEGMKVKLHKFLTSALDRGEWSGSYLDHFSRGGSVPSTH